MEPVEKCIGLLKNRCFLTPLPLEASHETVPGHLFRAALCIPGIRFRIHETGNGDGNLAIGDLVLSGNTNPPFSHLLDIAGLEIR